MNRWKKPDVMTTVSERDCEEPESSNQSKAHSLHSKPADDFQVGMWRLGNKEKLEIQIIGQAVPNINVGD